TGLAGEQVLVARSAEEGTALWKKHAPKDREAPAVDFDRWMVVGITTPAGRTTRAIYRIELDDAARPTELLVRVASDDAICQKPRNVRIKGANVHLVATGKSALPVRFIKDDMVDGGLFGINGGVDEHLLGNVPGIKPDAGKAKAAYREQAEQLV